jgi:hypothetical protein
LAQKIANGEAREGSEVRGTRSAIDKVKRGIQYKQNSVIEDVVDEENEAFFIVENEKDTNLLREATNMHELLATSLWEAKLREYNPSVILILIQIPIIRIVRISLVRLQNFYPCSSTNPLIVEMRK